MSDRRFANATLRSLTVVAALGFPAIATGQSGQSRTTLQIADDRANALRDRFLKAWSHRDALDRSLDSAVRVIAATPPLDTVVAGAIVIRLRGQPVPPALRAAITRGTSLAWATAQAALGAGADQFAGHPLTLTRRAPDTWDRAPRNMIAFSGKYVRWRQLADRPAPERIAEALLDLYGSIAGSRMDSTMKAWTQNDWLPLARNDRDEWEQTSVGLATSRSSYGRRCYEGVIADCGVALDLVRHHGAEPLRWWYRQDDIPALVSEYRGRDSVEQNLFRRCTAGKNAAVCDSAAGRRAIVMPLSISARHSLLAFALERGGADAYARLTKGNGAAADQLAATAGIPINQLLTEWRAKVRESTPERTLPGPLEGVTILAWTALFATLATRRRP